MNLIIIIIQTQITTGDIVQYRLSAQGGSRVYEINDKSSSLFFHHLCLKLMLLLNTLTERLLVSF